MNCKQAAHIVKSLQAIGDSVAKIGDAAERTAPSADKIAEQTRAARGPLRTIAASAWADLLGRLFGR